MLHFALSVVLMVLLMTATSLAGPPRLRPDQPDAIDRAGGRSASASLGSRTLNRPTRDETPVLTTRRRARSDGQ
jgi:hypothetical protein